MDFAYWDVRASRQPGEKEPSLRIREHGEGPDRSRAALRRGPSWRWRSEKCDRRVRNPLTAVSVNHLARDESGPNGRRLGLREDVAQTCHRGGKDNQRTRDDVYLCGCSERHARKTTTSFARPVVRLSLLSARQRVHEFSVFLLIQ